MYGNGADASLLEARNVSNALETPASLPVPPDRFWGDPASTRDTFDNFSDFRFLHFYIGFPSTCLKYLLFNFLNGLQQSGGLTDHSMHPSISIPQEVCILEISYFPESGKFQENFKKRASEVTDRVSEQSTPL